MSKYIDYQFLAVVPELNLKDVDLDLKIKISGSNGSTNWLNIDKDDCELIKQILANSYNKRG